MDRVLRIFLLLILRHAMHPEAGMNTGQPIYFTEGFTLLELSYKYALDAPSLHFSVYLFRHRIFIKCPGC